MNTGGRPSSSGSTPIKLAALSEKSTPKSAWPMLGNPIYRKLMSEVRLDWQACDALVLSVSRRKPQSPLRWEGACMSFGLNGHGASVILLRPSVTDLMLYLLVTVALALS